MQPRKPRLPFANAWFFPAAALHAALLLPISVLGLLDLIPALPGLATPAGHAREMLFGFALAVIAGYLLGPQPLRLTLALLACWLLARLGSLFWPGSWLASGATLLFAAGLVWKVLPRFIGAAKKWRNQSIAPVVGGFALLSAVTAIGLDHGLARLLQHEALLLLAALLFFMGGRIIAPALAGHAQNEGRQLNARVQPQLEGAVLILLALALLLAPLPWLLLQRLSGAILITASALTGMRLLRWQPWHCRTRMDLLALVIGYAWLALGLLLLGLNVLVPSLPTTATLHALSVGALGSLTFAVMARTRLVQRFRDPCARRWIHPLALLLSLAALARVVPPLLGWQHTGWMLLAAGCWTLAFLALLVLLWQCRDVGRHGSRHLSAEH
ncbi:MULTISPECIES: NnrS family protein [Pseudomonadaceae]|uniref:NnrS family protein n=1 Tax=Pseudomonadaceae TaxID=135621 RepID=UPI000F76FEB4|nr:MULTISPECIES: NnrS family protein [Pseudomonadaceae]MCF6781293.1 NnrS family protein [Stutzerimonas stutzeri]MCF6805189.1 NnrS family protein [Stutzerimonas stutzeri]RRV16347.1 NnrS family protein [Pseudomonas saudiphocaensis]